MSTTETHPVVERARRDVAAVMAGTDWQARAEVAEAKVAGIRAVLLEGGQPDATARRRALAVIGSEEEARDG
jgi:hypothetical protein